MFNLWYDIKSDTYILLYSVVYLSSTQNSDILAAKSCMSVDLRPSVTVDKMGLETLCLLY